MSIARLIAANTVGQVVFRGIEIVLGIATLALITRYLGAANFGYYTTANAFLQIATIIVDGGLYLTLLREISSHKNEDATRITNNIFTMRLCATSALLILAILFAFMLPYTREVQYGIAILSVSYLVISLLSTLTALFQKNLRMISISSLQVGHKALLLVLVVIAMYYNAGLTGIFLGASVASTIAFIPLYFLLRRIPSPVSLRLAFDIPYWREVLQKTWPIAVTTTLNLVYFRADMLLLSLLKEPESVGLYGAAYRVIEILTTFPHMFMGLVMPLLTAAWIASDTKRLKEISRYVSLFFVAVSFPVAAGTVAIGEPLLKLIAGPEFIISGSILKILIFATVAIFFGTFYTYLVLVIDQQKKMIKHFALTAVIALIGYSIAIPYASYWGAAWVTLISEIIIMIAAWATVRRSIRVPMAWNNIIRIACASIAMGIIAFVLAKTLPVLIVIIISFVLYGIFVIALKAIPFKELRQLIFPSHELRTS